MHTRSAVEASAAPMVLVATCKVQGSPMAAQKAKNTCERHMSIAHAGIRWLATHAVMTEDTELMAIAIHVTTKIHDDARCTEADTGQLSLLHTKGSFMNPSGHGTAIKNGKITRVQRHLQQRVCLPLQQ